MKQIKLIVECEDCNGTGLYSGMCEAKGEAVVCLGCNGTGAMSLFVRKYTGRKSKRNIKKIQYSRGTSLFSCGGHGKVMTYKEFLQRIPPLDAKEAVKSYKLLVQS